MRTSVAPCFLLRLQQLRGTQSINQAKADQQHFTTATAKAVHQHQLLHLLSRLLLQLPHVRSQWTGLGWAAGLGWASLGWAGLDWAGLDWAELGWAGQG